jgi:hypothetical protein
MTLAASIIHLVHHASRMKVLHAIWMYFLYVIFYTSKLPPYKLHSTYLILIFALFLSTLLFLSKLAICFGPKEGHFITKL